MVKKSREHPRSKAEPTSVTAAVSTEAAAERKTQEAAGALLADALDRVYQKALDLLETQIEGVDAMETVVRTELKLEGTAPVLGILPERAINPQEIYRILADRLVQHEKPRLDPRGTKSQVEFHDLIVWRDEPLRLGLPYHEYLLRKVRFARGKSLRDLHQHILMRLTPEDMPEAASANACHELIKTLCVEVPPTVIVPFKETTPVSILYMMFNRTDQDLPYHLNAWQVDRLTQALLAFATLASLDGNGAAATQINEAANGLREKLRRSKHQYHERESVRAGIYIDLILRKDTAEFHVDKQLMKLFQDTALGKMRRLEFVHQ